ncbi:RNI-like protein [Hesseltinella vesiculosa]|uniref:RNI-like protein n=1 Tax=Hesseltinella vesiculosa TaxID=101127 RepID=A0A1X2GFU6_9FUNG|nr:RNI-like protein [Hesseltinella vesiculosa]
MLENFTRFTFFFFLHAIRLLSNANTPLSEPVANTPWQEPSNDMSVQAVYAPDSSEDYQRQQALEDAKVARLQKRKDAQHRKQILEEIKHDRQRVSALKPTSHPNQPLPPQRTVEQQLKLDRNHDRLLRQQTLDRIKLDRLERKEKAERAPPPQQPTTSSSKPTVTDGTALIQFKLIDGTTVHQRFPAATRLNDVIHFVLTKESQATDVILVSPYPRRIFTKEQGSMTVAEAGFLPNVSLNVSKAQERVSMPHSVDISNVSSPDQQGQEDMDIEMPDDAAMNTVQPHNVINPHRSRHQHQPQQPSQRGRLWHNLSQGQRLGGADDGSTPAPENYSLALQPPPSPPVAMNTADQTPETAHDTAVPDRQSVLAAIQQRASAGQSRVEADCRARKSNKRTCRSLKEMCTSQLAVILSSTSKDTHRLLRWMPSISPDLANVLCKQLMETKKLNNVSLGRMARSCYLEQMNLDAYVYATDSMLSELSNSHSLAKLSVRGCDLITDAGIRSLQGLSYLGYLDLNHCKMTDKGFMYLAKLPSLHHLNLGKTHITDKGLGWWAQNAMCHEELGCLVLSGCQGIKSPATMAVLDVFKQLRQLKLDGTGLGKQQVPATLALRRSLQVLDLQHTVVTDDDLMHWVAGLQELQELRLTGCLEITKRGLASLARGLPHLSMIQFPNREHDLDDILHRYRDLPLRSLDLQGFLEVTDEGMSAVAQMTKLTYLNLTGTKITDAGLAQLTSLDALEVLYLEQTCTTDQGMQAIKELKHLHTLSLARTLVTDHGLAVLTDEVQSKFVKTLHTLNLQQCSGVTDQGAQRLAALTNLTLLNLNHTGVSPQCLAYFTEMPHLKPMRLLGVEQQQPQLQG